MEVDDQNSAGINAELKVRTSRIRRFFDRIDQKRFHPQPIKLYGMVHFGFKIFEVHAVDKASNQDPVPAFYLQYRRPDTSGSWTGVTQTMQLTATQISARYGFPHYDYTDPTRYNSLQLANFDSVPTNIIFEIGGVQRGTFLIEWAKTRTCPSQACPRLWRDPVIRRHGTPDTLRGVDSRPTALLPK